MMTFAEAPSALRGLTDLSFFIQFILLVTVFLVGMRQKRVFPLIVRDSLMICMALFIFLLYQLGVGLEVEISPAFAEYVERYGALPFVAVVGISIIMSLILTVYIVFSFDWTGKHITDESVKEAVDNLPGGICIYEDSGRIIIKNNSISILARKMMNKALLDGNAFRKTIESFETSSQIGDKYVVFIEDNTVWSFAFDKISDENKKYNIIICDDISEEYKKTLELQEIRKEVMNLNVQLTQYNREIVSTISEREVLEAKIKIHDELGTGLLAIKHYLTVGGSEADKTEIIDRVKRNIIYLKSETERKVSDEYELMITTAKTLGVDIDVQGELPEAEPYKHIVATAIHECFTNTLRHAGGNLLSISITKTEGRMEIIFTNNGEPPKAEISEKGGLQSLHSLVNGSGGEMKIVSLPEFSLHISLPCKEV